MSGPKNLVSIFYKKGKGKFSPNNKLNQLKLFYEVPFIIPVTHTNIITYE